MTLRPFGTASLSGAPMSAVFPDGGAALTLPIKS